MPLGLKYLILDGILSNSSCALVSLIESKTIKDLNQLNIFFKTKSLSRNYHLFESIHICWMIQKLSTNGYDRFGVSINCYKSVSPSIFIDGKSLNISINNNLSIAQSANIVETNMLWFDGPSIKRKFFLYSNIFKLSLKIVKFEIIDEWKKLGLKLSSTKYQIKKIENRSTKTIRRIMVYIYLTQNNLTKDEFIDIMFHAIKKIRKKYFYGKSIKGNTIFKRKVSYIWINIYLKDDRFRTLSSLGWTDSSLILKLEWITKKFNSDPIFFKKPDFIRNGVRFKFNPELNDFNHFLK